LVSGDAEAIQNVQKLMKEKWVATLKPKVSAGFHCGLLKSIKEDFES